MFCSSLAFHVTEFAAPTQIVELANSLNRRSPNWVRKLRTRSVRPRPQSRIVEVKQSRRRHRVKRTIIALVCGLVAPLAFAQTSTTTTEETTTSTRPTTTTQTTTDTTYETGTVTTYEPGKTIVVRGDQGPVSFALGTAAHIVNAAGQAVTAPLRAGQKVRVYYTGPTERRTVERVIVED